jgi:hypothetical protein
LKKVVEPPVKKGLLRKGFLNPHQSASSREVEYGFSQTQASPVVFYLNREIVAREKVAEFWERLSMEWTVDRGHREEFMAIMDKMIEHQKTKGKRDLGEGKARPT